MFFQESNLSKSNNKPHSNDTRQVPASLPLQKSECKLVSKICLSHDMFCVSYCFQFSFRLLPLLKKITSWFFKKDSLVKRLTTCLQIASFLNCYSLNDLMMVFFIRILTFKCQLHKMVKHTKQFVGKLLTNCLNVFNHFLGLARKGLSKSKIIVCSFTSNITLVFVF